MVKSYLILVCILYARKISDDRYVILYSVNDKRGRNHKGGSHQEQETRLLSNIVMKSRRRKVTGISFDGRDIVIFHKICEV
jgi:hypothetical protein